MLELAHKLADCDPKYFTGGWVLAGVEAHVHGAAARLENITILEKERRTVLEVLGTTAFGTKVKSMRVFMVKPKEITAEADNNFQVDFPGKLLVEHIFTKAEIDAYVAYTGDENIIHKGEHPIVPGICMACFLQDFMGLRELDWRIAFKAPVYADDKLVVYVKENQLTAYVNERVAFLIKY